MKDKCPLCWSKLSREDMSFVKDEVDTVLGSLKQVHEHINDEIERFEFNLLQRLEYKKNEKKDRSE